MRSLASSVDYGVSGKAHVHVATTSVIDVTTRHGHLTTTPASAVIAISSTLTPLAPMPPLGNFGRAFHSHDTRNTGWIIDSGATDHMTYNSAFLYYSSA
ncbi:unnamed protein product [Prunus armeniaca]